MKKIKYIVAFIFLVSAISYSCRKKDSPPVTPPISDTTVQYNIKNNKIYKGNAAVQLIGANALHVFSAGSSDMAKWNIDISREFVGNIKEQPLTGATILDANGSYLHSLQSVVDSNKLGNRITIIGAFGWDGTPATLFTGTMPTKTAWWNDYKTKLQQWAVQFKNQPNVWLEVWNEPYTWNGSDGYTDDIWMSDMNTLVSIVRSTGNNNIILVPCAKQGQDESVLNNKGQVFLTGKTNILFDIHAYELWQLVTPANIGSRLQQLQQNNLPVFFGEVAPLNSSGLMNAQPFLDSAYNRGISISAWAWKYDSTDVDALLNNDGTPNNNNNNGWGSMYNNVCFRLRKP